MSQRYSTALVPVVTTAASPPLFPVILKHPRCRPFFRLGQFGVVAARVDTTPGSTLSRIFDREDVEMLGGDAHRVHLRARENLRALFEGGAMNIRTGRTQVGHAYLVIEHPTLAASCLFLPGLTQKAATFLGGTRFACVILRRDLIAVFQDHGARTSTEVARSIARVIAPECASLGELDLFALDEIHPQPMTAPPPPAPTPTPAATPTPPRSNFQSGLYERQMKERGLLRPRIRLRSEPTPPLTLPPPPPSIDPPTIKAISSS